MAEISRGIPIEILHDQLDFRYGNGVFGPSSERRTLDSIRQSLKQPDSEGPEIVYSIAMDVGKHKHRNELLKRMLLFGVVTYASGQIGNEPIRSQGHIHKVSRHSGWSPPEVYEIWSGAAFIYMQESASDDPGRCYAVLAKAGDVVVVPPYWAHATISADPKQALTFGAWCDREYGFEYDDVRRHQGLAWYPIVQDNGDIGWEYNDHYQFTELILKSPEHYNHLGIERGVPIYKQFEKDHERFQWVSRPQMKQEIWDSFVP